jgi:hypothetical protein
VNRRSFLRAGLFGSAMLTVGNLSLTAPATGERRPARVLDDGERELLACIAERMVDTGEPGAPELRETAALDAMEHALASLDPGLLGQLRWALWLLDMWPALFELRFTRFRALSAPDRDASLEDWRTSSWTARRRVFYALRNLAMLGYWSQPETWRLIGYGGPWLGKPAGAETRRAPARSAP